MIENPLLSLIHSPTYFALGAVPFPLIEEEHFSSAIPMLIQEAKEKIVNIGKLPLGDARFETVLLPLEKLQEGVGRASLVFYNLLHAETNEKLQELSQTLSPMLSQFHTDLFLDENIFERVERVLEQFKSRPWSEEKRLIEKYHEEFIRSGAKISEEKKQRIRQIDEQLSQLSLRFQQNLLQATNDFTLTLTDSKDLSGLPESAIQQAREEAKRRGTTEENTWVFTLHAPSYGPFLTFSDQEHLRKILYIKFNSRSLEENDGPIREIVTLREERAKILGYDCHADSVLEQRMVKNKNKVNEFLQELLTLARPIAEKELESVKKIKKELTGNDHLNKWDLAYYSEKYKQKEFQFSEEDLRPYFPLPKVKEGLFEILHRLFGLRLIKNQSIPVYHEEVEVFEVHSGEDKNSFQGLLYLDFFPRAGKQGGAWQTTFQDSEFDLQQQKKIPPHVSLVCNFTRPTADHPSLLTLREVETFFHEMGHGLHTLLSECKYRSVAGTNVKWDFVEFPSQLMENWVHEREAVDLISSHYLTGEKIPEELWQKMQKAQTFQEGLQTLRQLSFALLDMGYHQPGVSRQVASPTKLGDFEKPLVAATNLLPDVEGTLISPSFSHIFSGGYAAGYYSYKWAEVLEADAFELFKEQGIFNQQLAKKLKENILSQGDRRPPDELYLAFRGKDPSLKALLRRGGLFH